MSLSPSICIFLLALCTTVYAICNKPRIRRAWGELTFQEQDTYLRAITLAYQQDRFDKMSEIHWNNVNFRYAHQTSGFFPWHRWFIYKMEDYLRTLGPEFECITLTYWDWEYHNGDATTATHVLNPTLFGSITNVRGCVRDGFFSSWSPGGDCVRRTWNRNFTIVGQKELADIIVRFPQFGIDSRGYRSNYEAAPHSNVHNWLGGNMGTSLSTYDPIFYLHHTNVDRHYSMWQDCHDHDKIPQYLVGFDQYAGNQPNYNGIDDVMPYGHSFFPELITPRGVHHIQGNTMWKMDYSYSKNRYAAVINQNNKDKPCQWDWIKSAQPAIVARNKRTDEQKAKDAEILQNENNANTLAGTCTEIKLYEANIKEVAVENDSNGKLQYPSSDIILGYNNLQKSEQMIGLRFKISDLPSSTSNTLLLINSTITFKPKQDATSQLYLKIYIEDDLHSASFDDKPVSQRTHTNDKVQWTIKENWLKAETVSTPDISSLLQGLVSSPSWDDGVTVGITITGIQSNAPYSRTISADPDDITLSLSYCEE